MIDFELHVSMQALCALTRLQQLHLLNAEKPASDDVGAAAPATGGLQQLPPEICRHTALTEVQLEKHACLTELPVELFALTW